MEKQILKLLYLHKAFKVDLKKYGKKNYELFEREIDVWEVEEI